MSGLRKRFAVDGLGIERLMDTLQKAGVTLYDVRRVKARRVEFSTDYAAGGAVEEISGTLGFSLAELPETGLLRALRRIKKRWLLLPVGCCALLGLMLLMQHIWEIEITGAGIYQGEAASYLREANIRPGIRKSAVDTQKLCDGLLYRLPQIAWVRAEIRGTRLCIDIVTGIPAPKVISADSAVGNIVAASDGIVERIDVFSGTARVKPGATVKKGDVLIEGKERSSYGDVYRPVTARGRVIARVWLHAEAAVSAVALQSTPTGSAARQFSLCSPWARVTRGEEPEYLAWDAEVRRIPLGGVWFPLWAEEKEYFEVALERVPRDMEEIRFESGLAAMQKIYSLCNNKEEIVDKALNFRMIEGDNILAAADAEVRADIGRFIPESLN